MTPEQRNAVIVERLRRWGHWLAERPAIPCLLIGLEAKAGAQIVVTTVEGMDDDQVETMLRDTLESLSSGAVDYDGPLERRLRGKRLEDLDETELREMLTRAARALERELPPGRSPKGTALHATLVFDDPRVAQYISNCDRSDMIRALRETADRLERKAVIDR